MLTSTVTLPEGYDTGPDPKDPMAVGGAGRTPLDIATHTVRALADDGYRYLIASWEGCGEASVVQVTVPSGVRPEPGTGDPERSRLVSLSRTRTQLRRYCSRWLLNRLITLTFAEEPDLDGGWIAVESFRRALRVKLGHDVPMAVVPEYGSKGGRLHFHAAIGQYVPRDVIESCWPHGFIDIRKVKPKRGGGRAGARAAAGYLAGYLGKGGAPLPPARKRYSTTRGTAPVRRSMWVGTLSSALWFARESVGTLETSWCSSSVEGWEGPTVWLFMGDGRPPDPGDREGGRP